MSNNDAKAQRATFERIATALTFGLMLTLGPTVFFLLLGDKVLAAICATLSIIFLLSASHIAAFAAGARYTRGSMQVGAAIALKAQEIDDRSDDQHMKVLADVFRQGATLGKVITAPEVGPALPLPSQMFDWMPEPSMLTDGNEG